MIRYVSVFALGTEPLRGCFTNIKKQGYITRIEFPGVNETELLFLEKLFDVSITVFELREDSSSTVLWISGKRGKLNMNLHRNHFSYIRDVEGFPRDFQCEKYHAQFTLASSCRRHNCDVREVTSFTFPGGAFTTPKCIWEEVSEELGIEATQCLRILPYRATYDIESLLTKDNLPNPTNTTTYENKHTLLSVSVCANVPGYDRPRCFVVQDSAENCIRHFGEYLESISQKAKQLNQKRYATLLKRFSHVVAECEKKEKKYENTNLSNSKHYARRTIYSYLEQRVKDYIAVLPVFWFNSQCYDLNVKKPHLMRILTETPDETDVGQINVVVKKQDSMTYIQTFSLHFLDTTNFFPPGYIYEAYLKAHGASLDKGFLPYEWMDDIHKLNHNALPSQDTFFSRLTGKSISDEVYATLKENWHCVGMTFV